MTFSVGTITQAQADSANNVVVTVPSGLVAGDVLVFVGTHQNQPATDWTLPGAFTRQANPFVANDPNYRGDIIATHVVSTPGSEPASYTFTFPGTGRIVGALIPIRGIDTTAIDDGHPTASGTTSTNDKLLSAFTVGHDGSYLFVVGNNQLVSPNALGVTVDSGMSTLASLSSHPGADNTTITRTQLAVFGKTLGVAAAAPTVKVSWPALTGAGLMAIAFRAIVGNTPPVAAFTHSEASLTTTLDGTSSSDADGTIASYDWNYGDGSAHGTTAAPTHTYAAPGAYTVTLTVTDNGGATNAVSHTVTVAYPTATVKRIVSSGVSAPALVWKVGAGNTKLAVGRVWKVGAGMQTPAALVAKSGFVFGHMGESWDEVEGSAESIVRALMQGVDGVMLSLQRTLDGQFFIMNDVAYLDRMTLGNDVGTTLDPRTMNWSTIAATYDQGSYWTKRATSLPRRPYMLLTDFLAAYPTVGPIMIDPKTIPSTYFGAILDIMDANGGPTRFIAKNFCTGTGWADAAHARNASYKTWGYFYAAGIADASTPLSLAAGHWDWIGLDNAGASAQWTSALALGKPIIGHIAKTKADYDLGMSKGASGIMAAGVAEVRGYA